MLKADASGPVAHRRRTPRARRIRDRVLFGVAMLAVFALAGSGIAVARSYLDLSTGIHRSAISLPRVVPAGRTTTAPEQQQATNILIMGLDSRLDENGNPLPAATYEALHAGDGSDGGYNTNVLMLIHIPAHGNPVGISIPRDDWVSLPGAPDGAVMGKIKQAYGLELDQTLRHIVNTEVGVSHDVAYQEARAAARQEELLTVSQFIGQPIDHFIEVTMAAFYEIAQAVQPVEVCLNEATTDTYSGANFQKGYQELSASQAVSFVRQRRDTSGSGVELTDLDRERREQAFIVALAYKLRHENVLGNLGLVQQLIDTAKQNIALDSGFNLLQFASEANKMAGGGMTFQTLPIVGYGVEQGEDVNIVNQAQDQQVAAQLIAASDGTASTATAAPSASPSTGAVAATAGATASATASAAATPSTTTTSAAQPLASGAIPCVN
ncbi:LCP family protein [Curtobacterium ammoniigenes]|uniref:LCP family protein n=1 Tax=Curtobacterium ammoniigenes TaxID=395387 RepID=UPI000A75AB9C|nr:LCP family protein [Curtobacterium ammoniigenes]